MSTLYPVILNGLNYPEWKVKMEHYIKAVMGIDDWISIMNGWSPPMTVPSWEDSDLDMDFDSQPRLKPMTHWTDKERNECEFNSSALNTIFCSVGLQQFKLIATCKSAKEAWEKLRAIYEKTGKLRHEELDDLQLRFCKMKMDENESISAYYDRVIDIAYEAGTLGLRFGEKLLVSKIIGTLTERFLPVASDIRQRMDVITVGELIGELRAYEKKIARFYCLKKF